MTLSNSNSPMWRLFTAACVAGLGTLAGCSTLSSWGNKTVDAVSGAGAAVRDSVTGTQPAVAAPAGRRANDIAPPRQPAPTAPASAVGLGRSDAPPPAPAPAPVAVPIPAPAPAPVAQAPAPAAAPAPRAVPVPPPATAQRAAPAPTPAPRPALAPAPAPTPVPRAASAPAPVAAAAPRAAASTAVPAAAARAVTPGHYTVQIAAFAVAANAEATRNRVNARLAAAGDQLQADERVAQIARIGDRSYVVVGDSADRAGAEALAKRLRSILNQDVAVIRM